MVLDDRTQRHENVLEESKSIGRQTERWGVHFDERNKALERIVLFLLEKTFGEQRKEKVNNDELVALIAYQHCRDSDGGVSVVVVAVVFRMVASIAGGGRIGRRLENESRFGVGGSCHPNHVLFWNSQKQIHCHLHGAQAVLQNSLINVHVNQVYRTSHLPYHLTNTIYIGNWISKNTPDFHLHLLEDQFAPGFLQQGRLLA